VQRAQAFYCSKHSVFARDRLIAGLAGSALGHLAEIDDARRIWDELKQVNPKYSFAGHLTRLAFDGIFALLSASSRTITASAPGAQDPAWC
jgi:hypothetical protein